MQDIKSVKHLQYLDISAIPFDGLNYLEITSVIEEFVIKSASLIHLDMS